jgi:chorismate mutase
MTNAATSMNFLPLTGNEHKRPMLIAGPCSAETEAQVLQTARELSAQGIDLFRAGIWKPRTRPGEFEGVGTPGLAWLRRVKEETGLKTTTEVANTQHVLEALKYGIDVLWIGARTTVNPFSVQEVADAVAGVDIPVIIKNPVNPDLKLWIGAIERIYKAGITRIAVVHRGFSHHGETRYRNVPRWEIPIELKRLFPDLPIICDNSHICGRRDTLAEIAQQALDLNYDGLMTEVHPTPDDAWSDAAQQITPTQYGDLINKLSFRSSGTEDTVFQQNIDHLRNQIDDLDDELFQLLGQRMKLAQAIGVFKKRNNIAIVQPARWNDIVEKATGKAKNKGLSDEFVEAILRAVHHESIQQQSRVIHDS